MAFSRRKVIMSKTLKPEEPKRGPSIDPEQREKLEKELDDWTGNEKAGGFGEEALKLLAENLEVNHGLADFFFEKVLARPDRQISRLLIELEPQVTSKPVHKRIKRSLYLLKQRGIEVPREIEGLGREKTPGILKGADSAPVSGYLSEFDQTGARMLALLIPKAPGEKWFVFALIDSLGGLENLTVLEASKKRSKEILAELKGQSGRSFLMAEPKQVTFLLKEAHDRKSLISADEEKMFAGIMDILSGLKKVGPSPIIRSLFPKDLTALDVPLETDRLLAIPEVGYYHPSPEVIESYKKDLQDIEEGVLILSEMQKREQMDGIVQRAVNEIFQGREKENLTRFWEEVAYLYYLKGRLKEAEMLASTAYLLETGGDRGVKKLIPLLNRVMEKALGLVEVPQDDQTETPLFEKSQGGIILPTWVKREERA
jgi:hypothetical protein